MRKSTNSSRLLRRSSRRSGVVGLVPDIHIPKEDPAAIHWALQLLKRRGISKLVLLGDVVCLDSLSRFLKSLTTAAGLPDELKTGRRFFAKIEKMFGDIPVTLLLGNHEERLAKYLLKHAPALAELPELSFESLFRVPRRWRVVKYGDYIMEQGVLLQHGKKWGQATCRGNILLGCSSVQGHSHRVNVVHHRQANGRVITAAELGCLCSMDQGYARLVNWSHACGVIAGGAIHVITPRGVFT